MDTQLSRFWRSMTAQPCCSSLVLFWWYNFERTGRTNRMQPTCYRPIFQLYCARQVGVGWGMLC